MIPQSKCLTPKPSLHNWKLLRQDTLSPTAFRNVFFCGYCLETKITSLEFLPDNPQEHPHA